MISKVSLPESNVADVVGDVVADVVDVSSVDADNPTKQLRVAITAILTVRGNIVEHKLDQSLPVFRKLDIVNNNNNNMPYFMNFHVRGEATISLPPSPLPSHPHRINYEKKQVQKFYLKWNLLQQYLKGFDLSNLRKAGMYSSRWKYCQNNNLFCVTNSIEMICLMTRQRDQVLYQAHRILFLLFFL